MHISRRGFTGGALSVALGSRLSAAPLSLSSRAPTSHPRSQPFARTARRTAAVSGFPD